MSERLPSVPQWWLDYGMTQEQERRKREAIKFDERLNMKKTYHYYCTGGFANLLDAPVEDEMKVIRSLLLPGIVRRVIALLASGVPPYWLTVPSEMLCEAHEWAMPTSLLTIVPKPSREDYYPFYTAELEFENATCVFHALRCTPGMSFTVLPP